MRVRYVKPGVSAKIGDIRDHPEIQARVLIKLGVVEPYIVSRDVRTEDDQQPAETKPARKRAAKKVAKKAAKKVARKRTPKRGEAFGNLPTVSKRDDEVPTKKETSD